MATFISRKELLHLSKLELIKKCKKAKLATNGSKGDMVNRLIKHSTKIINKDSKKTTKKIKSKISVSNAATDFDSDASGSKHVWMVIFNDNSLSKPMQIPCERDDYWGGYQPKQLKSKCAPYLDGAKGKDISIAILIQNIS
eukprot:133710_1